MKAVVLVGGEGTRLRPLTETVPKPLLPFMNRPFLLHVLDRLAAHGVGEVVLSSPYLEEEFRPFLEERAGGPAVTWVTEEQPLGTAGAVGNAREHLGEAFLVLNGDVLTDLDVTALVAAHRQRGAVATIALTPVEDARPYGLVDLDRGGRVVAFREKPTDPVPGTVNAGTYVLEPSVLETVPPGREVSIERETFPALIAAGEPLFGLVWEGYWRDVGTPEAYLAAHLDALEGRIGGERYPRPFLGDGAVADARAVVGELVVAGPGARIAAGAAVDRSVLHHGAVVEEGAHVVGSILGPWSRVEAQAVALNAVLAEGARVPARAGIRGDAVEPGGTWQG